MYAKSNVKTETVKVTLEFFNDDGSKDIVTTELLDARDANRTLSESRVEYGISRTPTEPSCLSLHHEYTHHDAKLWSKDFFRIDMKLPLDLSSNNDGAVYHSRHIEPPLKYVIMVYIPSRITPIVSQFSSEETVQFYASVNPDFIYFMLDVPE